MLICSSEGLGTVLEQQRSNSQAQKPAGHRSTSHPSKHQPTPEESTQHHQNPKRQIPTFHRAATITRSEQEYSIQTPDSTNKNTRQPTRHQHSDQKSPSHH